MKIILYYLLAFCSLLALCHAQQGTCYSDSYCASPVAYSVTKDACFRALYKGWRRNYVYYYGVCEIPLFTFGLCSYSFTCEGIATIVNVGYTKHECCNIGTGVAWQRPTVLGLTCELCGNGLGHCYTSTACTRTFLDHITISSAYIVPWTGTPEQCYERGGVTWQGSNGICYSLNFGECYYSFTCTPLLKVRGYYTKTECCNGGGTGWAKVGQQCEPCPYQYACFPGSGCSGGFLIAYNGSGGDRCCDNGGQSWIGASTRMCTPCPGTTTIHIPADLHLPTLPTQPPRGTLPIINQELPTHAETMPTTRPEERPASDEATSTLPPSEEITHPTDIMFPSDESNTPSPSSMPPSITPSTVPPTDETTPPSTVPPSDETIPSFTVPPSDETITSVNSTSPSRTLPLSDASDESAPSGVNQGSAASRNRCNPAIVIFAGAVLLHMLLASEKQ